MYVISHENVSCKHEHTGVLSWHFTCRANTRSIHYFHDNFLHFTREILRDITRETCVCEVIVELYRSMKLFKLVLRQNSYCNPIGQSYKLCNPHGTPTFTAK